MAKRRPPNLIDIDAATLAEISRAFKVTEQTVHNWLHEGLPRNEDKSFSVHDVHKWLVRKLDKGSLTQEKLRAEIERIKAQTDKIGDNYILRTDHEQMINSWASSFKKFWAQAVKKNIMHFCGKEIDQLHVLFESFGRQLMEVWADMGTKKDDSDKV